MDPLSFKAMGDADAVGLKYGRTAGGESRTVYPQTKLVDDQFQEGRTIIMNWKSDENAFWSARGTRLNVEYEFAFGETNETASDAVLGAQDGIRAPPAKTVRMAAMSNSALFDSQVRFVQNNVTLESCPNFYTTTCAQMLMQQNQEGPETSGSAMLNTLRKDRGLPANVEFGSQNATFTDRSDASSRDPLIPKKSTHDKQGGRFAVTGALTLAELAARRHTGAKTYTVVAGAAGGTENHKGQALITVNDPAGALLEEITVGSKFTAAANFGTTAVPAGTTVKSVTHHADRSPATTVIELSANITGANIVLTGNAPTCRVQTLSGVGDVNNLQLVDLAAVLEAVTSTAQHKDQNPNAKFECLQQSWDGQKCTVQSSQPLYLSTWMHPYATANSEFQLHLTISPDYLKDLLYCHSGCYGCAEGNGGAIRGIPTNAAGFKAGQIYVDIKSVSLETEMVFPIEPYVPRSMSYKVQPYHVAVEQLTSDSINSTVVVPASTRAVLVFLRQRFKHICADREEIGLAGGGIVESGAVVPASRVVNGAPVTNEYAKGRFEYFSSKLTGHRDTFVDSRQAAPNSDYDVAGFQNIQVSLGNAVAPREQIAQQDLSKGKGGALWKQFVEYIHRSHGYRSLPLNFAEYCGTFNSNYASFPGCGDRTSGFFCAELQNPPGTLATDLAIRAQLHARPGSKADMEMVVIAVSDSLVNIGWTEGNSVASLTEINPIV